MSTENKTIEAQLTSPAVNLLRQIMSVPFTKDWLENMRIAKFNRQLPNCELAPGYTQLRYQEWRLCMNKVVVSDNVRDLVRRAIKSALDKEQIGAVGEVDEICEALNFEP